MSEAFIHGDPPGRSDANERLLEIDVGDGSPRHVRLTGETLTIGRAPDAEVHLARSSVSRHHAELFRDPFGRWWVRDLSSRNGTRVNGFEVSERMLDVNDRLQVGEYLLTLKMPAWDEDTPTIDNRRTDVQVMDTEESEGAVHTLEPESDAQVAASHLATLMRLGEQLQATEAQLDRMVSLCQLMIEDGFHASSAVVIRVPREGMAVAPRALCPTQAPPNASTAGLAVSNSLIRTVQRRGVPAMAISGSSVRDTHVAELSSPGGTAALACPLRIDDREIDLLYVTVPAGYGNEAWLNLAALAAEQYRLSDNVWTARNQAKINAMVEHDLERARDIQLRLLPQVIEVPEMDVALRFQPCRWVAGDYVDVVPRPNGRTLMVIADVCGKGLSAALVSASLHTMVRASTRAGASLADVVLTLNEYLCDYLPTNRFVTAFFLEIDPATGEMSYVNLGHPNPWVFKPDGSRREMAPSPYEPMGIYPTDYQMQTDLLEPREMLALYTDGLTEMRDRTGAMLGDKRLADHLSRLYNAMREHSTDELADELNRILDQHQGSRIQADDRTFLLARRLA